jgi:hypothetical protein
MHPHLGATWNRRMLRFRWMSMRSEVDPADPAEIQTTLAWQRVQIHEGDVLLLMPFSENAEGRHLDYRPFELLVVAIGELSALDEFAADWLLRMPLRGRALEQVRRLRFPSGRPRTDVATISGSRGLVSSRRLLSHKRRKRGTRKGQ